MTYQRTSLSTPLWTAHKIATIKVVAFCAKSIQSRQRIGILGGLVAGAVFGFAGSFLVWGLSIWRALGLRSRLAFVGIWSDAAVVFGGGNVAEFVLNLVRSVAFVAVGALCLAACWVCGLATLFSGALVVWESPFFLHALLALGFCAWVLEDVSVCEWKSIPYHFWRICSCRDTEH